LKPLFEFGDLVNEFVQSKTFEQLRGRFRLAGLRSSIRMDPIFSPFCWPIISPSCRPSCLLMRML